MSPRKQVHTVQELKDELVDFNSLKLQVAIQLDVLGRNEEETLSNIESLVEQSIGIDEARSLVCEFNRLISQDKVKLVDLLWENKVFPDAAKWQIEQIIAESNEKLSLYEEDDQAVYYLLSILFFKLRGEDHLANDRLYLAHMRAYAEHIMGKIREALSSRSLNRAIDQAFLLGYVASSMHSSQLYSGEVFKDAIGRTKSGMSVSEKRHKRDANKYSQLVDLAVAAWAIGCQLLHPQMARLLSGEIDSSLSCARLKKKLAGSCPEDRLLGNAGVKKLIDECPCPKMYECPIGRKTPRGKRVKLLANCPAEKP